MAGSMLSRSLSKGRTSDTWNSSSSPRLGVSEHNRSHHWPQTWRTFKCKEICKIASLDYLVASVILQKTDLPDYYSKLKQEEEAIHATHRLSAYHTKLHVGHQRYNGDQGTRYTHSLRGAHCLWDMLHFLLQPRSRSKKKLLPLKTPFAKNKK